MAGILQLVAGMILLAILLLCLSIKARSVRNGEKQVASLLEAIRTSEAQLDALQRGRGDVISRPSGSG